MTETNLQIVETISDDLPTVKEYPEKPIKRSRMYYIDKLRTSLTLLVVIHHCFWIVIAGWFPFFGPWDAGIPSKVIGYMILSGDQAYFMGLFFFLAGLVFGPSLKRKGSWTFLADRFIRLMVPAILYDLILFPLLLCFLQATWYGPISDDSKSFNQTWSYYYSVLGNFIFMGNQMWFTVTLFALSCIAVIILACVKSWNKVILSQRSMEPPPSKNRIMSILAIIASASVIVNFLFRLPFQDGYPWYPVIGNVGFVGQYLIAISLGMIANSYNFLDNIKKNHLPITISVTVITYMLFQTCQTYCGVQIQAVVGFYGKTFLVTLFEQFFAVFWSYSLLVLFKEYCNTEPSKFVSKLIGSAYATYIIHQWIITPLAAGLAYTSTPSIVVIIILCFLAPPLSWSAGLVLKMIPGSQRIL